MIDVINLATGQIQSFSCSPFQAVVAAYAQSKGDWNTWTYAEKYAHVVWPLENEGRRYLSAGDFSVRLPDASAQMADDTHAKAFSELDPEEIKRLFP